MLWLETSEFKSPSAWSGARREEDLGQDSI